MHSRKDVRLHDADKLKLSLQSYVYKLTLSHLFMGGNHKLFAKLYGIGPLCAKPDQIDFRSSVII